MDWKEAVMLAKDGKEEGYNYLYQQTYQKSYYVALKYMKQEEAALDVLQEAYIKGFRNLEQLQEAEKFPAWFSKIVASKALDELKKNKALLFSQIEDEDFSVEESFRDDRIDTQPELSMDKAETSRLVQEMIDTLSDEQRLCVMMYYVEEMTVKDIAESLEVSENTVKSRLNYGRKNIKEKVLELEKKGTKLYSLTPIPFFLYLLLSDVQTAKACELPVSDILESAVKEAVKGQQGATASTLAQVGGKTMSVLTKKIIIGIVSVAVVGGAGSAIAYNVYQSRQAEEVMAVSTEQGAEDIATVQEEEQQETVAEIPVEKAAETEVAKTEENTDTTEATETQPIEESVEEVATQPEEDSIQFTFTDLLQTMYAANSVNVRDLPNTDGKKLGGLATAQEVSITGQCNETGWYRISYKDGDGYVSNKYIVADKPVIAKPTPAPKPVTDNANAGQTAPAPEQPTANSFPHELYTVVTFDDHTVGFYYTDKIGAASPEFENSMRQGLLDMCNQNNYSWTEYRQSNTFIGNYDEGGIWVLKGWLQ